MYSINSPHTALMEYRTCNLGSGNLHTVSYVGTIKDRRETHSTKADSDITTSELGKVRSTRDPAAVKQYYQKGNHKHQCSQLQSFSNDTLGQGRVLTSKRILSDEGDRPTEEQSSTYKYNTYVNELNRTHRLQAQLRRYHHLTLARSQSAGKSSVRRQSPISSPARWARSDPSENQKLHIQEWTSVNLSIYTSNLTTKCLHSKAPQPRTVTDLWRQRSHTQTVTTTHIKNMGVFANILRWYDQSPQGSAVLDGPARYLHQRGGQGQVDQSRVSWRSVNALTIPMYLPSTLKVEDLTLKSITSDQGDGPALDRQANQCFTWIKANHTIVSAIKGSNTNTTTLQNYGCASHVCRQYNHVNYALSDAILIAPTSA